MFTEVRVGYFIGVRITYRRDEVCIDHARFHEVYTAVAFQVAVGEQALVQADDVTHNFRTVNALVLQVMNGINHLHVAVEAIMVEVFLEEHAHEACVPVVAVDNVRLEANLRQHGEHGAAEVSESFGVIAIAVKAIALEVLFIVDEVHLHAVPIQLFHAVVQLAPR